MLVALVKSGKELNRNLLEMVVGMGLARMFMRGDMNSMDSKLLSYYGEHDKAYFNQDSNKLKELSSSISKITEGIQKKEREQREVQTRLSQLEGVLNHSIALIEADKSDGVSSPKLLESANNDNLIERFEDVREIRRKLDQVSIDRDTALHLAEEEENKRIQIQKELETRKKELKKNGSSLYRVDNNIITMVKVLSKRTPINENLPS